MFDPNQILIVLKLDRNLPINRDEETRTKTSRRFLLFLSSGRFPLILINGLWALSPQSPQSKMERRGYSVPESKIQRIPPVRSTAGLGKLL